MNGENNATCSICGKGYYMCQSCKDQLRLSPWKVHTDTSEHYKIFQIIRGYSIGLYTKDEAKNKIKNVNLDDLESFIPEIQSVIKTILDNEKTSNDNEIEDTEDTSNIDDDNKTRKHKNSKSNFIAK